MLRVNNGVTESIVKRTDYNILEETLARRTSEESGDYVIQPFDIDVREHKDDGSNRGIFAADSDSLHDGLSATASEARLAVGLSPGKAYVKGFEIDTTSQKFVTIEKARDFDTIQNSTTRLDIGNFVNVTNIHGSYIGTVSMKLKHLKNYHYSKIRILLEVQTTLQRTQTFNKLVEQNLVSLNMFLALLVLYLRIQLQFTN